MIRIPGKSTASKAAFLVVVAVVMLAIWTALAIVVALFGLHQISAHTNWSVLPDWLWFYRHSPQLHAALVKGYTLGGFVVALLVIFVFAKLSRDKKSQHGDAKFQDRAEVVESKLYENKGILVGTAYGRYIRASDETHVLLEAPTGAGKGVGIIIPNILERDGSSIILDLKGENYDTCSGYLAAHGVRVIRVELLNPKLRTHRFNPLGYINRKSEIEVIGELRKFAEQLYPKEGDQSFWTDKAKSAFVGVGAYIAETEELPFNFTEIYKQFVSDDPRTRFPELIRQRATSDRPLSTGCTLALSEFTGASEKTFSEIMSSVTAKFSIFLDPRVRAATEESDFDLADLRHKKMAIFLVVRVDEIKEIKTFLNIIFQQAISRALAQGEAKTAARHRVLLVLDEFYQLGEMPTVNQAASFVRSYGFNLLFVFQNRGQALEVDKPNLIRSNCDVQVVFAPNDADDAKKISERLGTHGIDSTSKSNSLGMFAKRNNSQSVSSQSRALMLPQEIMQMPEREIIVFIRGKNPLKADRITYYESKDFMPRLMKAPDLPSPGKTPALVVPLSIVPASPEAAPAGSIGPSHDGSAPIAAAPIAAAPEEETPAVVDRELTDAEIDGVEEIPEDALVLGDLDPRITIASGVEPETAVSAWMTDFVGSDVRDRAAA